MKILKTLLILIIFSSCSKPGIKEECDCRKETWKYEAEDTYNQYKEKVSKIETLDGCHQDKEDIRTYKNMYEWTIIKCK